MVDWFTLRGAGDHPHWVLEHQVVQGRPPAVGLCNCDDQIRFGFHGTGCTQNLLHAITFKQTIHQNDLGLGTAMAETRRMMLKVQHTSEWRLSALVCHLTCHCWTGSTPGQRRPMGHKGSASLVKYVTQCRAIFPSPFLTPLLSSSPLLSSLPPPAQPTCVPSLSMLKRMYRSGLLKSLLERWRRRWDAIMVLKEPLVPIRTSHLFFMRMLA